MLSTCENKHTIKRKHTAKKQVIFLNGLTDIYYLKQTFATEKAIRFLFIIL